MKRHDERKAGIALAHAALAASLPALFLFGAASLIHDAMPTIRFPNLFFALSVIGAGVASPALATLFRDERAGHLAGKRALALSLLAFYAFHVALTGGTLAVRAIPSAQFAINAVAFLAEWLWAEAVFAFLRDRRDLIADMEGRGDSSMFSAAREESWLMTDAAAGLSAVATLVNGLAVSLVALCAVPAFVGRQPSAVSFILVGAFLAYREAIAALVRLYREELALAGLGLPRAFSYSVGRLVPGLATIAFALAAAIALSSDTALVPTGWLFALLARLLAFLERYNFSYDQGEFDFPDQMDGGGGFDPSTLPEPGPPLFDPTALLAFLKYAALAAIAFGVAWFLFAPFFRKGFFRFFGDGRAARYLAALFAAIRSTLAGIARSVADAFRNRFGFARSGYASLDAALADEFSESVKIRAERGKSPEKREEIGHLTGKFLELIALGDRLGTRWQRSDAPFEYARRLGVALPKSRPDLERAGTLFEKGLYARELLGDGEKADYFTAIDRVTSRETGPETASADGRSAN